MRKFWKLGLIFGVVAFMAGCSNLWDYVPPPRVDNAPVSSDGASGGGGGGGGGKPSGGGGGGPTLNTLKFYVNDKDGTSKEVTVTIPGKEATIEQIIAAYEKKYGKPTPPDVPGVPDAFTIKGWFESDSNTSTDGKKYPSGTGLVIGFEPTKIGYTSSITTAGGGKREFLTDVNWGDAKQPLSEILKKANIDAGTGDYKPDGVPADWGFQGWATADAPTTILTPTDDTKKYDSGTNFVAVYNVPYKINIDGTTYTVTVPVTAPNTGATWEQIKEAAKNGSSSLYMTAEVKNKLDTLSWGAKKPSDAKASDFGGGEQFPANTSFEALTQYSYKITDINGQVVDVNFGLLPSGTVKTLDDIIAEAKRKYGSAVDFGSTHGGSGNVKISTWDSGGTGINDTNSNSTSIKPGTAIKPKSMDLTYKVDKGLSKDSVPTDKTVTVTSIPAPGDKLGATLKDILGGGTITDADKSNAPSDKDLAQGWKVTLPDGTEKIVSSSQINNETGSAAGTFPPGTTVEPNWVTNAEAATGGSDRNLSLTELRTPQIGDGVTSDGKIIQKDLVGQWIQNNSGKEILGYIYHVDEVSHKVKVVAKEVQPAQTWARQNSQAVYENKEIGGVKLSDKLIISLESGYDAWYKILGWNSTAILGNYKALMYSVCYPKQPSDYGYNISTGSSDDNQKIIDVVEGDGYDKRWYMPTVKELQQIYEAKDALLNWTVARHQKDGIGTTGIQNSQNFWSVIVSSTTATSAVYVNFTEVDSTGNLVPKEADKYGSGGTTNAYNIIPVADFKYEDYQVNH